MSGPRAKERISAVLEESLSFPLRGEPLLQLNPDKSYGRKKYTPNTSRYKTFSEKVSMVKILP